MHTLLIASLTDYLPDWLPGWLSNWFTTWLNTHLNNCLTEGIPIWLTDFLTDSLPDWMPTWIHAYLTEHLPDCLPDWQTTYLIDCLTNGLPDWLPDLERSFAIALFCTTLFSLTCLFCISSVGSSCIEKFSCWDSVHFFLRYFFHSLFIFNLSSIWFFHQYSVTEDN